MFLNSVSSIILLYQSCLREQQYIYIYYLYFYINYLQFLNKQEFIIYSGKLKKNYMTYGKIYISEYLYYNMYIYKQFTINVSQFFP